MALHKNNYNFQRFSPPRDRAPGTHWKRETSCRPCRESNPGCPARCPSRRHGHSSDKNRVYSTSHLFFTWFLSLTHLCVPAFNNLTLLQFELYKWTMFPRRRILRTEPRKTTPHCYLRAAAWLRTQKNWPQRKRHRCPSTDIHSHRYADKLSILYIKKISNLVNYWAA
jgi:hypothetical protein